MHLDMFTGAGAMVIGARRVLCDNVGSVSIYDPKSPGFVTFKSNMAKLVPEPIFAYTGAQHPWSRDRTGWNVDLLTAQLIDKYAQAAYKRRPNIDVTDLYTLVNAISTLKPDTVLIAVPMCFEALSNGEYFSYLWSALLTERYTRQRIYPNKTNIAYILACRGYNPQVSKDDRLRHISMPTLKYVLENCPTSTGSKFTPKTAAKFAEVSPGTLIAQKYRRLHWNCVCPALTVGQSGAKAYCHPDELRPLTVAEVRRVQGFPDFWEPVGTMASQYRQLIQSASPRHVITILRETLPEDLLKF